MRILFVLDEFLPENSGGAANVAFNLAQGLVRAGHELLVLSATRDSQKAGDSEFEGIPIKKILAEPLDKFRNWKNPNDRTLLKVAIAVFENFRPDIVHIHSCHHCFSYGVISLAKGYAKGVFFTLHDAQTIFNGKLFPKRKVCDLDPTYDYKITWLDRLGRDGPTYNPFQRFLIKKALKRVDKIFAVSQAFREAVEANGIENIEVIHNGIDAEGWKIEAAREKVILFAGRVDEAKGISVLVRIFDEIQAQFPEVRLVIVGDKDFRASQNKNIEVLPWLDRGEMKKQFSRAYLVVVPSLYLDPFPTVNLEAMASGKPVVGTCFGGTPEIVADGETGYIANPYDEKELADRIIDLLKNPQKAATLGKAGRERVEKFFSLEKQVQETLFWYIKF